MTDWNMPELRAIRAEELSGVARAFVATFNAAPWLEAWTVATASSFLTDLLTTPRAHAIAAWEDGNCLGAVLGQDAIRDRGLTHEVRELFVHPNAQDRGVGRALMERHLTEAEVRGVTSTFLLTARDSPAEAFYTRLGFRRAGRQIVLVRP